MERTRLRTAHSERTGDVARRSNYADVRGWENAPLPDAQRRAFFNLIKKLSLILPEHSLLQCEYIYMIFCFGLFPK